jgi:SAM-dependent methyltransferase
MPFEDASFDLVYSQGVIHHTYSTYDALKSISALVKPDGFLFVWVYGLADHLVLKGNLGFFSKLLYITEYLLRPVISRLPKLLRDIFFNVSTVIVHPVLKTMARHNKIWTHRNTNHSLRDTFSPKYAHRHDYNEVIEWYENLGFSVIDMQSTAAYRKLFGKRLWGVGLTGQKSRPIS